MTTTTVQLPSGTRLTVDPFAANPVVDGWQARNAALTAVARATNGPPPTMFVTGDLPPITASGVDPALLARLPWGLRHFAASTTNAGAVLGLLEGDASAIPANLEVDPSDPGATISCDGLSAYLQRVNDWLTKTPPMMRQPTPEQQAADAAFFDSSVGAAQQQLADYRQSRLAWPGTS